MKLIWNQNLGKPECPYMRRWAIIFKKFSLRLHHWRFGDDDRNFHDHAWNFYGVVLWGSYVDINPKGKEQMHWGKTFYREAAHRHTVQTKGCWTLILTGPEIREWGFWVKIKHHFKFSAASRYFRKWGHHQCES